MAGANKTSLQRRCSAAGLSIEGTKKNLLAHLSMYNSVSNVEAIIYKEAVQVPQNGELSKEQCCGQEIARELRSAIAGQSATSSACWSNPAGLLMLEKNDSHNELVDSHKKLLDGFQKLKDWVTALEPKLEATYVHSLTVRNRFLSSFLRDHQLAKYTPIEARF